MSVVIATSGVTPPSTATTPSFAFYYGDEKIAFNRVQRASGVERVLIKVHPDCRVEVAAPDKADDKTVLAAVKKRGRWIYQQLRRFKLQQQHIVPPRYISGESHFYLGKQYVLKVLHGDQPSVKLLRGKIEVTVLQKEPSAVQTELTRWYCARAKEIFAKRLTAVLEQTLWVRAIPPLRVLTMKTQWGNCSPNGRLTLNPLLVKTPRACIDYVILHELCHLAEHNHSARFYRLLDQVMPNWAAVKARLDLLAVKFDQ